MTPLTESAEYRAGTAADATLGTAQPGNDSWSSSQGGTRDAAQSGTWDGSPGDGRDGSPGGLQSGVSIGGGDAHLIPFASMTDGELRDPKQLVGLARAIDPASAPDRLAAGLFIAESVNVIERALAAGCVPFAVLTDKRWLTGTAALIERLTGAFPATPVAVVSGEEMRSITGYETTRGPLAAFHRPPKRDPRELLTGAHRVAVLEDITNYTNIGAIFRSAAALGIDAVLLTPACHDPLFRRASRVSMGTVFQVPWARIGSARNWADEGVSLLREAGFTTCALALDDDSIPITDERLKAADKLALVLGTEGDGLARVTIASCDHTVRIPMAHGVDSLNVAAASAVAFWETRWER